MAKWWWKKSQYERELSQFTESMVDNLRAKLDECDKVEPQSHYIAWRILLTLSMFKHYKDWYGYHKKRLEEVTGELEKVRRHYARVKASRDRMQSELNRMRARTPQP